MKPPQAKQKLKVVVRHLPGNLTEASFKESISAYLQEVNYFQYVSGKTG